MMTGLPDVQVQIAEPRVEITWPRPDVALFVLEGEHDLESAPRLEQALGDALLTCSGLLVDLSSVEFIDSSIIHVLVRMKKEADSKGSSFALVLDGSPNIERTLEICGVLGPLNRVTSVDAALSNGKLTSQPNIAASAKARAEKSPVSVVRITPRDLRVRTNSSGDAGSLVQALLQVIPAEDVAFVPATKEIVVSIRGDETIGVVLATLQDRLAAEDGGEITIRVDRHAYQVEDDARLELA